MTQTQNKTILRSSVRLGWAEYDNVPEIPEEVVNSLLALGDDQVTREKLTRAPIVFDVLRGVVGGGEDVRDGCVHPRD